MTVIALHQKSTIWAFLKKSPYLHLLSIGDLDDFFWPFTQWYVLQDQGQIKAVLLLYFGQPLPVVLALGDEADLGPMDTLLRSTLRLMPPRFYAHFSPGLEAIFEADYSLTAHGEHYRMGLTNPNVVQTIDTAAVKRLTKAELSAMNRLYAVSYPGNWFDARMVESGQYFGCWHQTELMSIAGIHTYSPIYQVAMLGNITTHPNYRGRGLARQVTAKLCQSLLETTTHIGLNVKADNANAISLYEQLGFEKVATYGEYVVEAKLV